MTCKLYAAIFGIPCFLAFFLLNFVLFFRNLLWLLDSIGGGVVWDDRHELWDVSNVRIWEINDCLWAFPSVFDFGIALKGFMHLCFCYADGVMWWDGEIYIAKISYCSTITQWRMEKLSWNLVAMLLKIFWREICMRVFKKLSWNVVSRLLKGFLTGLHKNNSSRTYTTKKTL